MKFTMSFAKKFATQFLMKSVTKFTKGFTTPSRNKFDARQKGR